MANISELRIPRTQGRLASTIKIKAGPDLDSLVPLLSQLSPAAASMIGSAAILSRSLSNLFAGTSGVSQTQSQNLGPMKDIGAVMSLTRDHQRENERRYGLGKNSFEPYQVAPLKITTSLTLKRVVLYKMDDAQRIFGFFPENLAFQQYPFVVQEEKYSPGAWSNRTATVGSAGAQTTVFVPNTEDRQISVVNIYFDCWFSNLPMQFDAMDGNQLVIQEAKIDCGRMVSYDESEVSKILSISEGVGALGNMVGTIGTISQSLVSADIPVMLNELSNSVTNNT